MNTNSSKSNLSDLSLNKKYTFKNFVVSKSNQFAYMIVKSICVDDEKFHHLYILTGKSGLGKTHLAQAIANCFQKKDRKVVYVTAEQFLNEFLANVRSQTMERFKKKYRTCDLLIIEDIQFFQTKETIQEEVLYIIEELLAKEKQIVFTSNINSIDSKGIVDRLLGKLKSALIVEIEPYDVDTKYAIIKQKADLLGVKLSDKSINYISKYINSNMHEVEGILVKLKAYSQLMHNDLDLKTVKKLLKKKK